LQQLVAVAIGQAEVEQHRVEMVRPAAARSRRPAMRTQTTSCPSSLNTVSNAWPMARSSSIINIFMLKV
jgi:hypothetical protein